MRFLHRAEKKVILKTFYVFPTGFLYSSLLAVRTKFFQYQSNLQSKEITIQESRPLQIKSNFVERFYVPINQRFERLVNTSRATNTAAMKQRNHEVTNLKRQELHIELFSNFVEGFFNLLNLIKKSVYSFLII